MFVKLFLFLSLIFLSFHMFYGLVTILQDYVHNEKTKYFGEILILLAIIETIKHFYIFFFFSFFSLFPFLFCLSSRSSCSSIFSFFHFFLLHSSFFNSFFSYAASLHFY